MKRPKSIDFCPKSANGKSTFTAHFSLDNFCEYHEALEKYADHLEGLLRRCLPIIQSDATMMADLTRFKPLEPEMQEIHDTTEYDSEKLVKEIPETLGVV
jgi:hypothetical protein